MFNIVAAQSGLKQFLRVRHLVLMYIQHLNKKTVTALLDNVYCLVCDMLWLICKPTSFTG